MRRVILHLAVHGGRSTSSSIRGLLKATMSTVRFGNLTEPEQQAIRRVRLAAADDLYGWLLHVLEKRLGVMKTTPGGRGVSNWALRDVRHPFVDEAFDVARAVAAAAPSSVKRDQLLARLADLEVVDPARWLRCLHDVGILRRSGRERYVAVPVTLATIGEP
jgi:hypothetical protein